MTRIAIMVLLGGCLISLSGLGGCSSSSKVNAHSTTIGQELQDLDNARSKGLVTEEEYQAKRKDIMNRE